MESDPVELASIAEFWRTVNRFAGEFKSKYRRVMEDRFGIDDGVCLTLAETGTDIGMSRARVHQIETKCLRMLRHPSRSHFLKDFEIL